MSRPKGAKLGLLVLLKVSYTIRGRGAVYASSRTGLLGRMTGWARGLRWPSQLGAGRDRSLTRA